jgi:hypothetical protein
MLNQNISERLRVHTPVLEEIQNDPDRRISIDDPVATCAGNVRLEERQNALNFGILTPPRCLRVGLVEIPPCRRLLATLVSTKPQHSLLNLTGCLVAIVSYRDSFKDVTALFYYGAAEAHMPPGLRLSIYPNSKGILIARGRCVSCHCSLQVGAGTLWATLPKTSFQIVAPR